MSTNVGTSRARRGLPWGRGNKVRQPFTLRRFLSGLPFKVLILALLVIEAYPMFWLVSSSFKTTPEFLNNPFWALPEGLEWQNFYDAWDLGGIGLAIYNSLLVTLPSVAVILVLAAAAGFALEVMVWKGRRVILLLIIGGIMVPLQMVILPLFIIYFNIGLTNTLWPLYLTYIGHALPLTVFLMASFYKAVPKEMFEAAAIDGAGIYRIFWSVGLPSVRNGLFTVGLLMFFSIYNDLLIALSFNIDRDLATIQVGLLNFNGEYGQVLYGPLFAAISMTVMGTFLVYLVLNQQIMKGLAGASVKG